MDFIKKTVPLVTLSLALLSGCVVSGSGTVEQRLQEPRAVPTINTNTGSRSNNGYILDTEYTPDNKWMLWHEAKLDNKSILWNIKMAYVGDDALIDGNCNFKILLEDGTAAVCEQGEYNLGPITNTYNAAKRRGSILKALQHQGEFGMNKNTLMLTFGREGKGLSVAYYDSAALTWNVKRVITTGSNECKSACYFIWPSENAENKKETYSYLNTVNGKVEWVLSVDGTKKQLTQTPRNSAYNLQTAPAFPRYLKGKDQLLIVADWGRVETRLYDPAGNYKVLPLRAVETLPVVTTNEVLYLVASCDDGRPQSEDLTCYTLFQIVNGTRQVVQRYDMKKLDPQYPYVFTAEVFTRNGKNYVAFLTQKRATTAMVEANNPSHVWIAELSSTGKAWMINNQKAPDGSYFMDPEVACDGACVVIPSFAGNIWKLATGL